MSEFRVSNWSAAPNSFTITITNDMLAMGRAISRKTDNNGDWIWMSSDITCSKPGFKEFVDRILSQTPELYIFNGKYGLNFSLPPIAEEIEPSLNKIIKDNS